MAPTYKVVTLPLHMQLFQRSAFVPRRAQPSGAYLPHPSLALTRTSIPLCLFPRHPPSRHGRKHSLDQTPMPVRDEMTASVLEVVLVRETSELSPLPAYWLPASLAF